jgi:hypothetical protein
MTKTLLITGLLSCFFTAAYTQHFSDRLVFDCDRLQQSIAKLQNPDIPKKNLMEKLPEWMIKNDHLFSSTDSLLMSELPGRSYTIPGNPGFSDNMPVAIPRGHFPSIIIKPDSTANYKLIIKKP